MSALKLLVGKHIGQQICPHIYQIVKKKEEKTVSTCEFTDWFLFDLLGEGDGMLRKATYEARLLSDPRPPPATRATRAVT